VATALLVSNRLSIKLVTV